MGELLLCVQERNMKISLSTTMTVEEHAVWVLYWENVHQEMFRESSSGFAFLAIICSEKETG
jgi:hypothetical protein